MRPALLLGLVALAPLAAGAGAFHHDGAISPAYGAFVTGTIHAFTLDLVAGQPLGATLAWAEPTADLDLLLIAPGIACAVLDPDCLLGAEGPVVGATCPPEAFSFGAIHNQLGPAEEALDVVAPVTGTYDLWAFVALARPGGSVPYALDLASDGDLAVQGPEAGEAFVGSPHCRFLRDLRP